MNKRKFIEKAGQFGYELLITRRLHPVKQRILQFIDTPAKYKVVKDQIRNNRYVPLIDRVAFDFYDVVTKIGIDKINSLDRRIEQALIRAYELQPRHQNS